MTHAVALRENAAPVGLFSPPWMLTLFAMLFLLAGFAQAAVSVRIEAADDPVDVRAYVTVTDNNGNPVSGLQQGAFSTTLSGNPTVTTFATVSGSLSVVFVMDSSGSLFGQNRVAMMDGVKAFIESMDAGDRASIVKFNAAKGPAVIQAARPFTTIENGPGSTGPGEEDLLLAAVDPYQDTGNGTNIFDALMYALQQFTDAGGSLPSGPKAIILLSDGQDNASTNDINDVLVAANGASAPIPIFTINVGDYNTLNVPGSGAALLNELAVQTGGTYTFAANATDIEPAYAAIETRLNNEYLLTFPFNPADCGPKNIVITVAGQATPFTGTFERCLQLFAPDLIGMTRGTALAEIGARGLVDDAINEQFHPTVPVNIVFGQNPIAGVPVDAGDAVDITVSVGPVPNVVGETQSVATTTLTSAGLVMGATTTQNSALAAGMVISQNPTSAAAGVPKGASVSLVVSLGPTTVTVPGVVGKTETAARADLSAVGLTNVAVTQQASATVPAGSVISQNPAGGTAVLQNVTVNLVISSGVPTVAVPDVVGQTQAAATTALTNAQLVLGTVTQQSSTTVASGSVISQTPAAGTTVQQGTSVSIVVSTGAPAPSGGGSSGGGGGGGGAAGLLEILACLGLALLRRRGTAVRVRAY